MRESNYKHIPSNRAALSITTSLYDRRALDCTEDRPLVNLLNHLTFLALLLAKVRETLVTDGGLERLVDILYECAAQGAATAAAGAAPSLLVAWKWTLAFQCLVLVGTRGSEKIRKRVVEAGIVPIIATVLDNYVCSREGDTRAEPAVASPPAHPLSDSDVSLGSLTQLLNVLQPLPHAASRDAMPLLPHPRVFSRGVLLPREDDVVWSLQLLAFVSKYSYLKEDLQDTHIIAGMLLRQGPAHPPGLERDEDMEDSDIESLSEAAVLVPGTLTDSKNTDMEIVSAPAPPAIEECTEVVAMVQRAENSTGIRRAAALAAARDLVNATRAPARLPPPKPSRWVYSQFPLTLNNTQHLDHTLDVLERINLFQVVERFSVKLGNTQDMCYWAGVVMRNLCRKDEARGGVRQCAYFDCGKWESYPRQFAKCRRCKRTKYCLKDCQLKAWHYHRHWCVQSTPSVRTPTPGVPEEERVAAANVPTGMAGGVVARDDPSTG